MKKVLTAILCLMMLCACVAAEPVRVEFGDAFYLMTPDDLDAVSLTENDISDGMVYAANNDHMEMYVWQFGLDGKTREELYSMWQEDEFLTNIVQCQVGETPYLSYDIVDEGVGAVFSCDNGACFDFVFYCEDDDAVEEARAILETIAAIEEPES